MPIFWLGLCSMTVNVTGRLARPDRRLAFWIEKLARLNLGLCGRRLSHITKKMIPTTRTSVSSTAHRKFTHRTAGLCRWDRGSLWWLGIVEVSACCPVSDQYKLYLWLVLLLWTGSMVPHAIDVL